MMREGEGGQVNCQSGVGWDWSVVSATWLSV